MIFLQLVISFVDTHAEKLVKLHCRGDKYKIDQDIKPRAVADDLIYNSGLTFAIPLFLYKIENGF